MHICILNIHTTNVFTYVCIGVNAILSVEVSNKTGDSAKLNSETPCLSPDLQCDIYNLTANNMSVTIQTTINNITESSMAYSYPSCTIPLTGLKSGTTYSYCLIAINVTIYDATNSTKMAQVGKPMCGNFTTTSIHNKGKFICNLCL